MSYLRTITDNQLHRLFWKIGNRIHASMGGGSIYGIDEITLRIVNPGLAKAFDIVRNECRRRSKLEEAYRLIGKDGASRETRRYSLTATLRKNAADTYRACRFAEELPWLQVGFDYIRFNKLALR